MYQNQTSESVCFLYWLFSNPSSSFDVCGTSTASFSLPVSKCWAPRIDCDCDEGFSVMAKTACTDSIRAETQNYLWPFFNDAELLPCRVRISLIEQMFCGALTFNLSLHLLRSIDCQICWHHWFWCHTRAAICYLDIGRSPHVFSGSWTYCLLGLLQSLRGRTENEESSCLSFDSADLSR